MDTRLLYTSGCGRVAGLINGSLQLLKEAIDILEIALGASVRQRKRVAVLGHRTVGAGASVAGSSATTGAVDVVTTVRERVDQAGCVKATVRVGLVVVAGVVSVARCDGKRQRVALQPLANIVITARIDSATLDVTEEVVERLDGTAASVHALNVLYVVVGVRDGAIASILCAIWLVVSAVGSTHLRLVARVRVHLVIVSIVGRRCEPRNQVSLWVRGRVRRILTLPVLWAETVTVSTSVRTRLR